VCPIRAKVRCAGAATRSQPRARQATKRPPGDRAERRATVQPAPAGELGDFAAGSAGVDGDAGEPAALLPAANMTGGVAVDVDAGELGAPAARLAAPAIDGDAGEPAPELPAADVGGAAAVAALQLRAAT